MKNDDKIDELLAFYEEHMPQVAILTKNKKRYDEVKQAIQDIADFAWETDREAQISVLPDELTGTSVCLTIVSSLIVVDIIDKFCNALKIANNFEIYPRTDGSVGLGIVFEGVFDPAPPADKKQ